MATKQEIFIPRTGDALDAGLYVSVNGEAYLLPRGKTSRVPAHIAAEIRRSEVPATRRKRRPNPCAERTARRDADRDHHHR